MCFHIWGVCPICGASIELFTLTKPCEAMAARFGSDTLSRTIDVPSDCPHCHDEFVQPGWFCPNPQCRQGRQLEVEVKSIPQFLDDAERFFPSPADNGSPSYSAWSPADRAFFLNAVQHLNLDNPVDGVPMAAPEDVVALLQPPAGRRARGPRAPQAAEAAQEPRQRWVPWTEEENNAFRHYYLHSNLSYAEMVEMVPELRNRSRNACETRASNLRKKGLLPKKRGASAADADCDPGKKLDSNPRRDPDPDSDPDMDLRPGSGPGLPATPWAKLLRDEPRSEWTSGMQLLWADGMLYILTITGAKLSILSFYLRIFSAPMVRACIWAAITFVGVFNIRKGERKS
ncbi:hypothetical protein C8A03DRAFT_36919 [Achaetomium macrosporum]|uniref:Rhodopsin domain-containing protein n=1 Tax=Achaetomium macrosporum TaxID=79813 RepID=A0AAN7C4H8_9PEZI|nr:hypothetical protein C8A03DRAFT_36919 [Achaetomium macrosporum]